MIKLLKGFMQDLFTIFEIFMLLPIVTIFLIMDLLTGGY